VRGTHSKTTQYGRRLNGCDPAIVVKHTTALTPEKAAQSVAREFGALQTVWGVADEAFRATLPKPLMVLPERGILVAGMLPGIPLSQALRNSINYLMAPFRAAEMCHIAHRIGAWLKQFHQLTHREPLAHDTQAFEHEMTQQLEGCVRRGLSRKAADEILRVASLGSRRIAGQPLDTAARHGDFTPRNVLVSQDSIGVIDFENFNERDAVYEDVGKFVAFLALLKGRPGYSKTAVNSFAQSFLEGYGIAADHNLVQLFGLKAAARIFAHGGTRRTVASLGLDYLYSRQFTGLGREYGQTLNLQARL
jgi:tRNA A-37 threonylcarbamoyl transferase component Bud32